MEIVFFEVMEVDEILLIKSEINVILMSNIVIIDVVIIFSIVIIFIFSEIIVVIFVFFCENVIYSRSIVG